MEPALGFEPRTDGLQNRSSTAELSRHLLIQHGGLRFVPQDAFSPRRNRTHRISKSGRRIHPETEQDAPVLRILSLLRRGRGIGRDRCNAGELAEKAAGVPGRHRRKPRNKASRRRLRMFAQNRIRRENAGIRSMIPSQSVLQVLLIWHIFFKSQTLSLSFSRFCGIV